MTPKLHPSTIQTDFSLSFAINSPKTSNLQPNLTTTAPKMYPSTFPSCGHTRKLLPPNPHPSQSSLQPRPNNTLSVPPLCPPCLSRIETNILRDRDLIAAYLSSDISSINDSLWQERRHPFNYIALIFERARLREALKGVWEEMEEEVRELREMMGAL